MPVFRKGKQNVLFAHIPKTGGTSIEKMFTQSGWKMYYAEYRGENKLNSLRWCSPQHLHADRLSQEFKIDSFDFLFCVVRHPYARFKSEFCMRNFCRSIPSPSSVEEWAMKEFGHLQMNPYHLDNHLRPQHEFILPGANIFTLESGMEAIAKALAKEINCDFESEAIHELSHKKFTGKDSAALPLSAPTIQLLNTLYEKDFELGFYSKTVDQLNAPNEANLAPQ